MPNPLPQAIRDAVAADIRSGMGRNAIARKHQVSAGMVTKIARAEGLWFENDWMTTTGSEAHRVDCELKRLEREDQLTIALLTLPQHTRRRDGRETKASRRLSYQLYDLHRHHG